MYPNGNSILSPPSPVECSVQGPVATITLARPDKLNALNGEMRRLLGEVFHDLAGRDEIRAIAIVGRGRAFCAGQDLSEAGGDAKSVLDRFAEDLQGDFLDAIRRTPQPTVVGIQGYCLGRGLMLALECSIRVGAETAVVGYPEIELGMIPGASGTQRLVDVAGGPRALDMILSGRRIDAQTAYAWGLLTRVVPDNELHDSVRKLAERLAERPSSLTSTAMKAVEMARRVNTDDGAVLGKALSAVIAADRASRVQGSPVQSEPTSTEG